MNTQKIVVLGGGESGTGAAILARKQGFEVLLSDTGRIADKYRNLLIEHDVPFECDAPHTESEVLAASLIIKSPGIPESAPIIVKARAKGIPVISEIEFAGRYTSSTMVCITGSNGKTTTTTLIGHLLTKAGLDASLAGNVGQSLALQVALDPHDIYVVELSSFQLDGMYEFHPHISILLNITPDHLDRYDHSMELYAAAKMRVAQNLTPADTFIYWQEDPVTMAHLNLVKSHPTPLPFGVERTPGSAAWMETDTLHFSTPQATFSIPRANLSLKGLHNIYNSMAAALAATFLGVDPAVISRGLADFTPVEHRLEPVATVHGVEYINDSKATNVASTYYALESMTRPTVLILGGTDKGNDYNDILPFIRSKVHTVVAMGVDNSKIVNFCHLHGIPVRDTHSLADAIEACSLVARSGDVVLLSPCCASFDLFKSYVDRGNQFKQAVINLK